MNQTYLLAFLTLVVCTAIVFICICRLNAMDDGVLKRVTSEYAAIIAAASLLASGPWIGEWPGLTTLGAAVAFLIALLCSAFAWKHDKPPETASGTLRKSDGSEA